MSTNSDSPSPQQSLSASLVDIPLFSKETIGRDLTAGLVVFLVALPLCLGIALASGAPLFSGIVAGIMGGLVVGAISGSHTSVSGPAAGLTAVVLAQIATLGSFDAFLLAVAIAGVMQIALGLAKAGAFSDFVPTSVIKGLLAAIGIILILKQFPHVLGHDTDPEGEMAFEQPDKENTFSELLEIAQDLHVGAAVIGLLSVVVLAVWAKNKRLSGSRVPAPLVVVVLGLVLQVAFDSMGETWAVGGSHLVQVPVAKDLAGMAALLRFPDFSQWSNPAIYTAAVTIAIVASLESILNLEAVDKLDPEQRVSPSNRELVAQGAGNIASGLLGGIPVTSVIIRGSVNVYSGAATKLSTIWHGVLLLVSVLFLPTLLNRIPLSCLAAILLVTGFKLASPKLMRQMWAGGRDQFMPFAATVVGIVFTDLLVGLGIGMAVSLGFILSRHSRRRLRRISEKHLANEVLHIELPELVTFLNLSALERALHEAPRGGHVLLDATATDYIDPDILALIREYRDVTAPARGIQLSMTGFHDAYELHDEIQFVDYSTRELQDEVSPKQVMEILRQGNQRFVEGRRLNRDLARQVGATARGQHPLAVVLSCIDSRTPAELVFDMGLGDIFSVRVAGNVLSPKVLGSMEYGCAVAGSRLVVVMGHTRCGAVTAAVDLAGVSATAQEKTGCQHLDHVLDEIQQLVELPEGEPVAKWPKERKETFVDAVARSNVKSVVRGIVDQSDTMRRLVEERRIAVVGVLYDVSTGKMEFMLDDALGLRAS
ncbi:bifunctional SulP family inorganic anion transporter/carbonic anhydrase [Paraliomyxa miuraensis]|uniref:bifunctional SulP family inorganic anion transporter/carbonic anhydrase n=1 Tax=Paraliomyxa miuraensis TaxID=376150 RepID=UPI00224FA964|nr:SulP family inorganic anion transporter [Paraliomyxa miuraensis]MCX4240222.1 SulP family inorganic anion transporter [Paraliomyxa miuraensis]